MPHEIMTPQQVMEAKSKSLIYKPEKGSAIQNYTSQPKRNRSKSPIQLQLTEIIEKFKPSFAEESHGDHNLSNTQLNSSSNNIKRLQQDNNET